MAKVRSTFRGAFCALALLVCSTAFTSSAEAQGVLRFVSGTGNDANNCLRPTPCRSINRGVESAPDGAEVIILDSAGYGPTVTINKSITITAPSGVAATVATPSGTSFTVSSGNVVLRGLSLVGQGTGQFGIVFTGGGSLSVENCTINGFTTAGISAAGANLFVKDTTVRNGGFDGISVSDGFATIVNCRIELNGPGATNGFGVFATNNARVAVSDTVASGNGTGMGAESAAGLSAQLNAENCVASNNFLDGFRVTGSATTIVRVSNSTATNNTNGFRQTGGVLESRGNNTVRGNVANTVGIITVIAGT